MRRPGWLTTDFWRGDGVAEGAMMRSIFVTLVAASAAMLALDLRAMMARDAGFGPGSERTEPLVMEPAKDADQERPYFPKAMPIAPGAKPPKMPGMTQRVTPEMFAGRMSFASDDDGNINAVGRIEPGTAGEFREFLETSQAGAKRVNFHSPGGSVSDAIAMGQAIRKANLATTMVENAYCASSCPLAFAGGVERTAAARSWIGVHQVYTLPSEQGSLHDGLANAQSISAECQDHLVQMGVDPRAWIKAMQTRKDRLYVFTSKELFELKLVTGPTDQVGSSKPNA